MGVPSSSERKGDLDSVPQREAVSPYYLQAGFRRVARGTDDSAVGRFARMAGVLLGGSIVGGKRMGSEALTTDPDRLSAALRTAALLASPSPQSGGRER